MGDLLPLTTTGWLRDCHWGAIGGSSIALLPSVQADAARAVAVPELTWVTVLLHQRLQLASQSQIINQNGTTSGSEMCFVPSTFGGGGKARLESSIKLFNTHLIYD